MIETEAGVLRGMSGGPCMIVEKNEIFLTGIILRSNVEHTKNVCVRVDDIIC